jgi:hypothetical protein
MLMNQSSESKLSQLHVFLPVFGCENANTDPTPSRFLHRVSIGLQICWCSLRLREVTSSLFRVNLSKVGAMLVY